MLAVLHKWDLRKVNIPEGHALDEGRGWVNIGEDHVLMGRDSGL